MKRLAGIRILIADDHRLTLEALQRLLELSGAIVTAVENGEQVLAQLENNPKQFDLILIDINMPKMDGLTATKLIRQDHRYDNLPIIAVTADNHPEDQLSYYQVGMNGHLAKPINLHKLREAILAVLDNQPIENTQTEAYPSMLSDTELKQQVLDRFGQNHDVIENLIPLYAQDFLEQLNLLKCTRDKEQIISSLHILKGLSGTIGAYDVYNYVDTFHSTVKTHQFFDEQYLEMLETLSSLHALNLQRLQHLFIKTSKPTNGEKHSDFQFSSENRKKIIHLLKQNDLTIIQYVNKLIKQFPNDNELKTLKEYVELLKFKPALDFILNQSRNCLQSINNDK